MGCIHYKSTVRGRTNPDGSGDIIYYGKVCRIPERDFGTDRHMQWETMPNDLLKETSEGVPGGEPVPGGFLERYEAYDIKSGDVLVLWRVPCQQTKHDGGA